MGWSARQTADTALRPAVPRPGGKPCRPTRQPWPEVGASEAPARHTGGALGLSDCERVVEPRGLEPLTPCLQSRRETSGLRRSRLISAVDRMVTAPRVETRCSTSLQYSQRDLEARPLRELVAAKGAPARPLLGPLYCPLRPQWAVNSRSSWSRRRAVVAHSCRFEIGGSFEVPSPVRPRAVADSGRGRSSMAPGVRRPSEQ